MKRKIIAIVLALSSVQIAFSQDLTKVMPPSPNASALAQYANVPINNYTGVPNISIPLYDIKSGEIALPISLSYHASGIKVSQEASNVGLGWVLNGGGVISRSVNGVDDLKPMQGYTVVDDLPGSVGDQVIYGTNMQYYYDYRDINSGQRDGKPDILYYNFLGESGKMVFSKRQAGSSKIKGVPLKQTNATFVYDVDKGEWEVTDGNGWKYFFNVKEISRGYSASDNSYVPSYLVNEAERVESFDRLDHSVNYDEYISGWFISKIITPKGDLVTFEYDVDSGRESITQLNFYEQESYYGNPLYESAGNYNVWYGTFNERNYPISVSMSASDNINLKKIRFKNGYIDFNSSDRDDQRPSWFFGTYSAKPQKLNSFEVFNLNGQSVKKVDFNYSYFNDDIAGKNKENYWRLKLNSLSESFFDIASDSYKSNPPYTFTYNYLALPAKTSAAVDHWGYFNGADNDHIRSYEDVTRELFRYDSYDYNYIQNPVVIQNSVLPHTYQSFLPFQIDCGPSSSSTWYPFLNGAYREPDEVKMQAGVLNKITYPTGGVTRFTYEPNKYDPNSDQNTYKYQWAGTSVWHNGDDVNDEAKSFYLNDYSIVKIDCSINNSGSLSQMANIKAQIETASGAAVIRFSPGTNNFYTNVQAVLPPGNYYLRANTHAPTESMTISMRVTFVQPLPTDGVVGAGLRISKQESLDSDGSVKLKRVYNYAPSGWTSGVAMSDIQHFYLDGGNRDYYSPEGLASFPYYKVVVRSSENSTPLSSSAQGNHVGYSEVSVSDEDQSGNALGKSTYYYSNIPDESGQFNIPGMPVITHMNNGDLIKEEHYNGAGKILKSIENKYKKDDLSAINIKGIFTKTVLKEPISSQPSRGIFIRSYGVFSEWWHPEKTIEINYDANGINPVTSTTSYDYENVLHKNLTKTTTTNSQSQTIISKNRYPQDLLSGVDETPSTIISAMTAQNLINPILQTETTVDGKLVRGTITNFKIKSYLDENNISQNMYLPKNIKVLSEGSTTEYFKKVDFLEYGKYGNLTEYKQADGTSTVYLWGYNSSYPIAEVKNATYQNLVNVLGQTVVDQLGGNTPGSDEQIRSSLAALRISLPNAQVTVNTYKPLVGTTSVTDTKGMTTYYEYDGLQRLKAVKDRAGNTIKQYDYHFKQQ